MKFLLKRWIRNKQQQFEHTFNYQKQEQQNFNRKEGDVTIEDTPAHYSKRVNDNVGEYVDFELVDDNE